MTDKNNGIAGVFLANYIVGAPTAGGVTFKISLLFSTADKSVMGKGLVFQATNPPLEMLSNLYGDYHYQCTKRDCYVMVNVDGAQPYLGIPPVGVDLRNTKLDMLLEENFTSGVANFSYRDLNSGEWVSLEQLNVEQVDCTEISNLSKLAETVTAKKA